jgi:3-hydroxymyristoyl/3-hydroxydecanoyl-(acyl carrier protein) dehydratase
VVSRDEVWRWLPQRPPLLLVAHFPMRPVWPGSYTIEGLAQACALAGALSLTTGRGPEAGGSADPSVEGRPGPPPLIVLAAIRIKLTGVVTPPARLDYFAEQVGQVGDLLRFAVEAAVGGRPVAAGTLDVALESRERVA